MTSEEPTKEKEINSLRKQREDIIEKIAPWVRQITTSPDGLEGPLDNVFANFLYHIISYMKITKQLHDLGATEKDANMEKLEMLFSRLISRDEKKLVDHETIDFGADVTDEMKSDLVDMNTTSADDAEGKLVSMTEGNSTNTWILRRWIIIMQMFLRVLGWNDVRIIAIRSTIASDLHSALTDPSCMRILLPIVTWGIFPGETKTFSHASLIYLCRFNSGNPWNVSLYDSSGTFGAWTAYKQQFQGKTLSRPTIEDFKTYLGATVEVFGKHYGNKIMEKYLFMLVSFFNEIKTVNHNLLQSQGVKNVKVTFRDPYFFYHNIRTADGKNYQAATPTSSGGTRTCGVFTSYFLFYFSLISHMVEEETYLSMSSTPPPIDIEIFAQFMARTIRIFHGEGISGLGKIKGRGFSDDLSHGRYLDVFKRMEELFIKWVKSNITE